MAYTATKYLIPRIFPFPRGFDNTYRQQLLFGTMVENDTSTMYSTGGIGSTSFQVTGVTAAGVVTYNSLKGLQLINGQRVVIFNTASNTNDGTYIVANVAATSTSAGTFTAVPLPGLALAGSTQTGQTAEGVGQIQFAQRQFVSQTFTATAVTVTSGVMKVTYTTLTGPQLTPGDNVILTGMANAGNNGTFTLVTATPTSSTAGSFTVNNTNGVTTDSGTGTGLFKSGSEIQSAAEVPINVDANSLKGWSYVWDFTNYTLRIFTTGASSGAALAEAALGASVAFDGTITFQAYFPRSVPT